MSFGAIRKRNREAIQDQTSSLAGIILSPSKVQSNEQERIVSTDVPRKVPARPRDPIYRIMHTLPRSDILEVVKCKFGRAECERAAVYFQESYMRNPLRRLRLQIGCAGSTGMNLFFPFISHHRSTLRVLDLSRNKLTYDDVVKLCQSLNFRLKLPSFLQISRDTNSRHASSEDGSAEVSEVVDRLEDEDTFTSVLEHLNLSYNVRIGNDGAVYLMRCLLHNPTIRGVQLRHVGIDDNGAYSLSTLLRARTLPKGYHGHKAMLETVQYSNLSSFSPSHSGGFFLDLNENCIGDMGTSHLRWGLPSFVSLTLCRQHVKNTR